MGSKKTTVILTNGYLKIPSEFLNTNFTLFGWIFLENQDCVTISLQNEKFKTLCKESKRNKMTYEFIVFNGTYLKVYHPDVHNKSNEVKVEKKSSLTFEGTAILSGFKVFQGLLSHNELYTEYANNKLGKESRKNKIIRL